MERPAALSLALYLSLPRPLSVSKYLLMATHYASSWSFANQGARIAVRGQGVNELNVHAGIMYKNN